MVANLLPILTSPQPGFDVLGVYNTLANAINTLNASGTGGGGGGSGPLPRVAVPGASKTLGASDANTAQVCTNATPPTLTIPTFASAGIPVGSYIQIENIGASSLNVVAGSGVTLNGTLAGSQAISGAYDACYIVQNATDQWYFIAGSSGGGGGITALTGDVTASGTGSVAATVAAIAGTTVAGATGSSKVVFSQNPVFDGTAAASTPGFTLTGAPYTAGTSTTNVPYMYFNVAATQPSTWSSSGTFIGFNAPSGFGGRFIDNHINGGGSVSSMDSAGGITCTGTMTAGTLLSSKQLQLTNSATTVSGSTSGNATFNQVFNGSAIKEVVIYCNALNGTASYTFATAFAHTPQIVTTDGPAAAVVTALSTTAVTVTGAPTTGYIFLRGN